MQSRIFPAAWLKSKSSGLVRPWIKLAIIGSVLVLSTAFAFLGSPRIALLILGLMVGTILTAIILRWPPIGLIGSAVAGLMLPFYGPSGLNAPMVLIAVLLGIWILDIITRARTGSLISSRTFTPLLVFVFNAVLSFGIGLLPWFSFVEHAPVGAQLGGLAIFILSAGAFILGAHRFRAITWLKALTWVFLALGGVYAVSRIIPFLRPVSNAVFLPVGSVFWIWLISLAFSLALFHRNLAPGLRAGLGFVFLAALYVVLIDKFADKSGWIPALVAVAGIIWARSPRAGLALGLLGFVPGILLLNQAIATDIYSYSTRIDAWLILAQIVRVSPIFGLGFANYHWYTPLYPIRGYFVNFNSHNNFVDIIAQTGLVGLALFLWFSWEVGKLGWRMRNRVPPGFSQAYVYAAIGGLIGMLTAAMMGDWVLPFFYNVGLDGFRSGVLGWIFLSGLVALDSFHRKKEPLE